jgi:hypothetical protein
MSPAFAYYGHHKCGSAWIMAVLKNLCRSAGIVPVVQDHARESLEELAAPPAADVSDSFLLCWNTDYLRVRGLSCRGFHVIRDPRDIVVSGYFSHLHSHSDKEWPQLTAYRTSLKTLNKVEGLMAEMEFDSVYFRHMLNWDYENPAILECRFEDVISDPPARFEMILRHLGMMPGRIGRPELDRVLRALSFERLSGGRRPGEENVRSHFRKGVPGDWKNHFSPAHITRFKDLYNPLLLKTGYETSAAW